LTKLAKMMDQYYLRLVLFKF